MERKILMSRESENIVRQWEEQKAFSQMPKLVVDTKGNLHLLAKSQPVRNQTAAKPQKKKKK